MTPTEGAAVSLILYRSPVFSSHAAQISNQVLKGSKVINAMTKS